MSKTSRTKGRRGEHECAAFIADAGFSVDPPRLNQTRDGGHDLDTEFGAVEVKRRAALPAYLVPDESVRCVFARADRGPWLVVVRADDWLRVLASEKAQRDVRREWCKCQGTKAVPVPVYDEHGRYAGANLEQCACSKGDE